MSTRPVPDPSFDDWLAVEGVATDARGELVDGGVFAMTGGTEEHNLIATSIVRELGNPLERRPCNLYAGDMKVRIDAANVSTYSDIMVVCGERQFYDQRHDVITHPALIIEILSDSTEAEDRGDKFAHDRSLPSLQADLLVTQTRVGTELYVRHPDGRWLLSTDESLCPTGCRRRPSKPAWTCWRCTTRCNCPPGTMMSNRCRTGTSSTTLSSTSGRRLAAASCASWTWRAPRIPTSGPAPTECW